MKIHCIRHEPFEGLASIEEWIEKNNHQLTYTHRYIDQCFPTDLSFDFLIIMGGTANLSEGNLEPYLLEELDFIKNAIRQNKKVLGICLGAQLLANALGARVYRGVEKEIGWLPVKFSTNGTPPLNFFPESMEVFHWHGDTFDIPKGAVHLASSEVTPNQGFIYKNNVVALQFHAEMTKLSVEKIVKVAAGEINKGGRYVQNRDDILGRDDLYEINNQLMFSILDFLSSQ